MTIPSRRRLLGALAVLPALAVSLALASVNARAADTAAATPAVGQPASHLAWSYWGGARLFQACDARVRTELRNATA